MSTFSRYFIGTAASFFLGSVILFAAPSPCEAQTVAGPFEKLVTHQLGLIDALVIVLASAATIAIAACEFSRGRVTVLEVPTMPKYTVPRGTYWSFSLVYVAIVFLLFVVVMERYEVLRTMLIAHDEIFKQLPNGENVLTISVGSVVLVVVLHYLKIPNTQIGPSWLLYMLRCLLHKRARIPEEAQALANQFLSDSPGIFSVPENQAGAVVEHPKTAVVSAADFRANRKSIDYQWAVASYLYMVGLDYETMPPYSSFVSNGASLWPRTQDAYANLAPRVAKVKAGQGDETMQVDVREKLAELRLDLSIFHACLHLFAISDDAERAERLKEVGLKHHAAFFVVNRSIIAKFLMAIVCGIAAPPLAFGLFARITDFAFFKDFAEPALIGTWILYGAPMYLLPIVMVMFRKRLMRASWPIRSTHDAVLDDPACHHRAEFKWDIYLLVFALSLAVAALPLILYNRIEALAQPASLWFALGPAAAAMSLAILIDFDVVDRGDAPPKNVGLRAWVLALRAAGFAVLLGGIVSWLAATLTVAPIPVLVVYAVTAAFIGIMIGTRADFDRNIRVV